MRAITVRQPWAWAIAHGGKDIENRNQNIAGAYRGPVAIHAGLEQDLGASRRWPNGVDRPGGEAQRTRAWRTRGAVVAVVDLRKVHDSDRCWAISALRAAEDVDPSELRMCSPWAMSEHYHLVLANPRPLAEPVPCRGRLGLWTLPDDVEAAVLAQIGGAL